MSQFQNTKAQKNYEKAVSKQESQELEGILDDEIKNL